MTITEDGKFSRENVHTRGEGHSKWKTNFLGNRLSKKETGVSVQLFRKNGVRKWGNIGRDFSSFIEKREEGKTAQRSVPRRILGSGNEKAVGGNDPNNRRENIERPVLAAGKENLLSWRRNLWG